MFILFVTRFVDEVNIELVPTQLAQNDVARPRADVAAALAKHAAQSF